MMDIVEEKECEANTTLQGESLDPSNISEFRRHVKYFVYRYYSKFNYDPEYASEFYNSDAVVIYDGQQYNGRDKINELLSGLKLQTPEVEIRELKMVHLASGETHVHMIGELKTGEKTMFQRFTQSLILQGKDTDTFRIISDITSFAFQIRGIAKKHPKTPLGPYKVVDCSSDNHSDDQVEKKSNKKRKRRSYFKRKAGKKAGTEGDAEKASAEDTKSATAGKPSSDDAPKPMTSSGDATSKPDNAVSSSNTAVKTSSKENNVQKETNTKMPKEKKRKWQRGDRRKRLRMYHQIGYSSSISE